MYTRKRHEGSSGSQFQTKSLNPWVCDKSFPQENNYTNSMFLLGSEPAPEVTGSAPPSGLRSVQGRKQLGGGCAGTGVGRPASL